MLKFRLKTNLDCAKSSDLKKKNDRVKVSTAENKHSAKILTANNQTFCFKFLVNMSSVNLPWLEANKHYYLSSE